MTNCRGRSNCEHGLQRDSCKDCKMIGIIDNHVKTFHCSLYEQLERHGVLSFFKDDNGYPRDSIESPITKYNLKELESCRQELQKKKNKYSDTPTKLIITVLEQIFNLCYILNMLTTSMVYNAPFSGLQNLIPEGQSKGKQNTMFNIVARIRHFMFQNFYHPLDREDLFKVLEDKVVDWETKKVRFQALSALMTREGFKEIMTCRRWLLLLEKEFYHTWNDIEKKEFHGIKIKFEDEMVMGFEHLYKQLYDNSLVNNEILRRIVQCYFPDDKEVFEQLQRDNEVIEFIKMKCNYEFENTSVLLPVVQKNQETIEEIQNNDFIHSLLLGQKRSEYYLEHPPRKRTKT